MKIWRAMWEAFSTINRDDGERYCVGKDPSLSVKRQTPKTRKAIWPYDEALRLVKRAIRMEFYGLAAALATSRDTQFSPVDIRTLTTAKLFRDVQGPIFDVDRTKTGKAAIGTLSRRTQQLLKWYIGRLPFTLLPETPIFHTRGASQAPWAAASARRYPTPRTPSPRIPIVRDAEFPGDTRKVSDFRRSGAIEAVAGKVDRLRWPPRWPTRSTTTRSSRKPTCPTRTPWCAWRTPPGRAGGTFCAGRRTEKARSSRIDEESSRETDSS